MQTSLQIVAIFGPLVLMGMGVLVALSCPVGMRRGHWGWIAGFVAVGIPVAVISYIQIHSQPPEQTTATEAAAPANNTIIVAAPRAARPHFHIARAGRHGRARTIVAMNPPAVWTGQSLNTVTAPVVAAPAPPKTIPANNLVCTGFTRDKDGNWEAGDNTEAFNVGAATDITIRDQGPIVPGWVSVGGVDLYALIQSKCGKR